MVRTLLESAANGYGFTTGVSEAAIKKYSAEYGAQTIAMETLADQQAVFECAFYDMEVLEFNSYVSGTPVTEGIGEKIKSIFGTIKEKLKKLWEKVKSWFHNVRRYIDGIFMDGADFVKKYKSELKSLKLDGFEYQLYKYVDTDNIVSTKDIEVITAESMKLTDYSNAKQVAFLGNAAGYDAVSNNHSEEEIEERFTFDEDKKELLIKKAYPSATTIEDVRDEVWSELRSGATRGDAKDSINITSLDPYIKALETSKTVSANIGKIQNKVDQLFSKALKNIDDAEKEINSQRDANNKAVDNDKSYDAWGEEWAKNARAEAHTRNDTKAKVAVKYAKFQHDVVAFEQTVMNAIIDEGRAAFLEMTKDYKAMLMKALAYKAPKK